MQGVVLWIAACHLLTVVALSEVRNLTGVPDFRFITLRWEYEKYDPDLYGFEVNYCELQAWGPHRCRIKSIDDSAGNELVSPTSKDRLFSVIISGLRMSTNYTIQVQPISANKILIHAGLGNKIILQTRGFSARASQCLPHASEIEVETGPHFGGRIAVEYGSEERCAVDGDPNSPRSIYTLRINHHICGSHVNETTVATFVLVQENLPILTHSTRRFLVLCSYQPETLTVRAGINLPSDPKDLPDNHVDRLRPEVISYDAENDNSANDVQVSRLLQNQPQLIDSRMTEHFQDHSVAQLVLMIILVMAGVIGCAAAAWWFATSTKHQRIPARPFTPTDDTSTLSAYENFENAIRDSASMAETASANSTPAASSTDSCSSVFSISVSETASGHNRTEEQPCITIEPLSHSEA